MKLISSNFNYIIYIYFKKVRKLILLIILVVTVFLSSVISPIKASNTLQCVPGTGGKTGVVCEPCYVNSYGICVPYLGLEDDEPTLSTEIVIVSTGIFLLGIALVANGSFLKQKFVE